MLSTMDIVVVAIFGMAVVGIGLVQGRREGTSGEEYFLAGHGLSWWLIGISLIAANISSEQFVGMNGSAAGSYGLAVASYDWLAAMGLAIVAMFILPRILRAGIYTMPNESADLRSWVPVDRRGPRAVLDMVVRTDEDL